MTTKKPTLSGTELLHADDDVPHGLEVSPAISVSTSMSQSLPQFGVCGDLTSSPTAFRTPEPWQEGKGLADIDPQNPPRHGYSRYTQSSSTRAEHVLSKILVSSIGSSEARKDVYGVMVQDGHAITYASGLAAAYSVSYTVFRALSDGQ